MGVLQMRGVMMAALALWAGAAMAREVYVNVDFCDLIISKWSKSHAGYSATDVTNILKACQSSGAKGVNWRVASLGIACHPSKLMGDIEYAVNRASKCPELLARVNGNSHLGRLSDTFRDGYRATMREMPDSLAVAVGACRALGLKINFWIDVYDEMFSKFTTEHPECLVMTRTGATFPGVRDYGKELSVAERIDELRELYPYRPDGFYLCPSSHSRHLDVNEEDEAFGMLSSEKFTAFLRRIKDDMRPQGFRLTVGAACVSLNFSVPHFSHHVKYRVGHDWKTWVDQGVVDGLVVADYERLREFDGIWASKGLYKKGGIDPAEVFLPQFRALAKGKVSLYYFSGWLTKDTVREVFRRTADDVLRYDLDGAFIQEAMTVEAYPGGFEAMSEMCRRLDAITPDAASRAGK